MRRWTASVGMSGAADTVSLPAYLRGQATCVLRMLGAMRAMIDDASGSLNRDGQYANRARSFGLSTAGAMLVGVPSVVNIHDSWLASSPAGNNGL